MVDTTNHCIRKVSEDGIVSTLVGTGEKGDKDGDLNEAEFRWPVDICTNGDDIYVADYYGNCV